MSKEKQAEKTESTKQGKSKEGIQVLLNKETLKRLNIVCGTKGCARTAYITEAIWAKLAEDQWLMEEQLKNAVSEKEAVAKEGADGEEAN